MILRMDNLLLAMWPPENLPECHGYPACYVILLLSTLPWNHCPFCRGITVHFGAEYAQQAHVPRHYIAAAAASRLRPRHCWRGGDRLGPCLWRNPSLASPQGKFDGLRRRQAPCCDRRFHRVRRLVLCFSSHSRRMVRHVAVDELERARGRLPLRRPDSSGHDVRAAAGGEGLGGSQNLQPEEILWSSFGKPRYFNELTYLKSRSKC